MLDGRRVESAYLILLFDDLSVHFLEARIEAVGYGSLVAGNLDGSIVCLDFGLGEAGFIEVIGAGKDEVLAGSLVHALLGHLGIEDDFKKMVGVGHSLVGRKCGNLRFEEFARESRSELVGAVVMMDAAAEPYLLDVGLESLEIGAVAVAAVVGVDILEEVADSEVVDVVLVPEDVAAPEGCFGEIVDQNLLVEGETVEVRHFVAEHFDIGETVDVVVEIVVRSGLPGRT